MPLELKTMKLGFCSLLLVFFVKNLFFYGGGQVWQYIAGRLLIAFVSASLSKSASFVKRQELRTEGSKGEDVSSFQVRTRRGDRFISGFLPLQENFHGDIYLE